MKKTLLAMTAITMTFVGCAPKKTAEPETTKSLVLYYSQTGTTKAVGEFSEQKPVTEAETAIFNAACGDYQFPLGTPLTFGSRDIAEGREYKFTVAAKGMDSSEAVTTIFVIDYNEEGAKPEFTQVVR